MKLFALVLFFAMYVVMIAFQKYRVPAVLTVAAVYILSGVLPAAAVPGAIDWNVLLMMAGTMVTVEYFIQSKMPNRIADILLDKSKNVMWVTIFMSLFAGVISAFIDNVATVLMAAPVGIAVCRKLKISPVPMILSIAVSSNLQGAATLVGDTTSIMLGSYAHMSFMDFFWMNGRPGIFFAVELGALATIPIMMILFRDQKQPVSMDEKTAVEDHVPGVMLLVMIGALICASFIRNKPEVTNGVICVLVALITMADNYRRTRRKTNAEQAVRAIDVQTLLLLAGLFLVIGGVTEAGIIRDFANLIVKVGSGNLFLLYSIIVWGSVAISAFVDNIPYVATMLPVVSLAASSLGVEPYVFFFGLLCGATLGGNLTPIGASANIASVGLLKKHGWEVSFRDFMRIGVPFTLTAVTAGYAYIWLVWH